MRHLAPLALACLLGTASCQTVSTSSATVAATSAIVAGNAFDGVEATAKNYVTACTPSPKPAYCSAAAIKALVPAVRSGRASRNALEQFVAANPAGTLVPIALYNAVTSATSTLTAIEQQYSVGAKS